MKPLTISVNGRAIWIKPVPDDEIVFLRIAVGDVELPPLAVKAGDVVNAESHAARGTYHANIAWTEGDI